MLKYTSLLNHFFIKYQYQIWLILVLLLCITILIIFSRAKITPTVKINNFFFTYVLVGIYISFYFFSIFLLRIYQLGKELDLKLLFEKYLLLLAHFGDLSLFMYIIYSLIFIILIMIWILIFIRIRKFLEFKLWQVFFYYKNIWQVKIPHQYSKAWSPYLMWKYEKFSFDRFSLKIYRFVLNCTNDYFNPSRNLVFKFQHVIRLSFFIIFLMFVLYECLTNNFVLFYSFYLLIVYMLIMIWIRIGLAIDEDSGFLEEILIERAYGEPNILYVNLTKEEEFLLELYIIDTWKALELDWKTELIPWFIVEIHPITYRCRFERISLEKLESIVGEKLEYSPGSVIYFNKYRGLYFFKKDLKRKEGKYFVNEEIQN